MSRHVLIPRFSLKTLLILVSVAALFSGWRAKAIKVGRDFRRSIEHGDEASADAMILGNKHRIADFRKVDRWHIRWVEIEEFHKSRTVAGWLLNHHEATMRLHVVDREGGFIVIDLPVVATSWGVYPSDRCDAKEDRDLPLALQWYHALTQ